MHSSTALVERIQPAAHLSCSHTSPCRATQFSCFCTYHVQIVSCPLHRILAADSFLVRRSLNIYTPCIACSALHCTARCMDLQLFLLEATLGLPLAIFLIFAVR